MNIKLDDQYLCEVYEYLCGIPFEKATVHDWEPPTLRHPGIEQMLKQIAEKLDSNEKKSKDEKDVKQYENVRKDDWYTDSIEEAADKARSRAEGFDYHRH